MSEHFDVAVVDPRPEGAKGRADNAEVAGVSLISNLAAGISEQPLSHDEVIEAGRAAEGRLSALLRGFCQRLS